MAAVLVLVSSVLSSPSVCFGFVLRCPTSPEAHRGGYAVGHVRAQSGACEQAARKPDGQVVKGGTQTEAQGPSCLWPAADEWRWFSQPMTHTGQVQELQPSAPRHRGLSTESQGVFPTSLLCGLFRPPRCSPDCSAPLGSSREETSMGTGRLRSAILILLSLCLAGRSSSLAGWVFTEPWLHASAGDSVLLRCLFQDPEATGWTVTKVDWLRVPGAGKQKEEMVFYYYSNSSVPVGRFQDRVRWQGDVSCWDGSIQLQDVQVNDSGRYKCEIRLFQHGSIFKNYTMLHVSPATQRDRGAESTQGLGHTGVWAVTVCCSAVAVVLAFLAGLNLRKRSAATTALERARNDGSKDKAKEGLYSSVPEAEVPKADQEAGKKRRAEETYITMHPSVLHENGIYVELARGVIPAEWMAEGRRDGGHSEQPYSQPQEELPCVPERGK